MRGHQSSSNRKSLSDVFPDEIFSEFRMVLFLSKTAGAGVANPVANVL